MKNFFSLLWRKKWALLLVPIILIVSGYWAYGKWGKSSLVTKYVTATVERGALISSISGTGQVSAANQIDISSKVAGDVLSVGNIVVGQEVKAGTLLFQTNAHDALKTVRDAQVNLDSAKLSLKKLQQAADPLTLLQAENTLAQAEESKKTAEDSLKKSYEDGLNTVTSAFLDLPSVMVGIKNILFGYDLDKNYSNLDWYVNRGVSAGYDEYYYKLIKYREDIVSSFNVVQQAYNTNFDDYKKSSRASSTSTVEALISETYETTKIAADLVKNVSNFIDFVQEKTSSMAVPTTMSGHQTSLETYTSQTNSHLTNLLSIKSTIESAKNSITNSSRTIEEKTQSLADIKSGADPLDIEAQLISVKQKENSLADAREKLADYIVRAPFDGMIASFNVKKGDTLSANTSVGVLITKQQIATIALNEVDVAKVKVGQKVTLTFDAVEDLTITGDVAQVDAVGTVSQGVVSYNVKIIFNVQDERVKSGMTVTANIILSSKLDVLLVKTSAIKSQNGSSYVEVLLGGVPEKKTVLVGDSNDTMTEIVGGLIEGDSVITQTISSGSAATTKTNATQSGGFGGGAGGGDVMRALR